MGTELPFFHTLVKVKANLATKLPLKSETSLNLPEKKLKFTLEPVNAVSCFFLWLFASKWLLIHHHRPLELLTKHTNDIW